MYLNCRAMSLLFQAYAACFALTALALLRAQTTEGGKFSRYVYMIGGGIQHGIGWYAMDISMCVHTCS